MNVGNVEGLRFTRSTELNRLSNLNKDDRVQALAPRPLQEGRPVRVPARVRHEQDAGVLLLHQIQ